MLFALVLLAADAFDPLAVVPVHVTIPAGEYAAMKPLGGGFGTRPKPPPAAEGGPREVHRNAFNTDLPWAVGGVTVGDQSFPLVGVRYKGNGTLGDATFTIKKSLKFDLDRAGGDGRFRGSRTVNLHCGVADPSKLRETLGYQLYRAAGVPAPWTSLAEVRLTVPGKHDNQLLGAYTLVEEIDRGFLRRHYGSGDGLLMKPTNLREFVDRGDDWKWYATAYAPKREPTPAEAKRVIAFARLVQKADDATFQKEIGSFLDVPAYLRFLAATAYLANPDSFFTLGHNYCLYLHPTTQRLHFLPWDVDRGFANFMFVGSNRQQMDLSLTRPYAGTHRLTERLLAMPGMSEKYAALLRELADGVFRKEAVLKMIADTEAAAAGLLERDKAAAAARKERPGGMPGFDFQPPGLREFADKRAASVAAQLAGTSKGFVPGGQVRAGDLMAPQVLRFADADGDGRVSRVEWLAVADKVFQAADGKERVAEPALVAGLNKLAAPVGSPPGTGPGAFLAGPIVRRADADGDKQVTAAELTAAAGKLFDEFGKAGPLDESGLADLLNALFPPPQPPPAKK